LVDQTEQNLLILVETLLNNINKYERFLSYVATGRKKHIDSGPWFYNDDRMYDTHLLQYVLMSCKHQQPDHLATFFNAVLCQTPQIFSYIMAVSLEGRVRGRWQCITEENSILPKVNWQNLGKNQLRFQTDSYLHRLDVRDLIGLTAQPQRPNKTKIKSYNSGQMYRVINTAIETN